MRIIVFRMDTQNELRIAQYGNLAEITGKQVVVGAKQLRKAINAGRAKKVFIARNADPAITEPVEAMCCQHQIPWVYVRSMAELGSACGIEVGAATAALVE